MENLLPLGVILCRCGKDCNYNDEGNEAWFSYCRSVTWQEKIMRLLDLFRRR